MRPMKLACIGMDESIIDSLTLPPFNLSHVIRLTDSTGIVHNANYSVPNYKEGYSLSDNSRALLMAVMAYKQKKDKEALRLIPTYLSYINFMHKEDGGFSSHLGFDRTCQKNIESEDSFGLTVWALGYLIHFAPNDSYFQVANAILNQSIHRFEDLSLAKCMAFTIIGICHFLKRFPEDIPMGQVLAGMTKKIIREYARAKKECVNDFGAIFKDRNGIIDVSIALFHAFEFIGEKRILDTAMDSMEYLEKAYFREGYLSFKHDEKEIQNQKSTRRFAQKPVHAMAIVLMYYQAYVATQDKIYVNMMCSAFMWFLGENDLGISLYDFETCGCCNALEKESVNTNQGAESTLAYLIAHLTILQAHE
jgi:hypothetical protein